MEDGYKVVTKRSLLAMLYEDVVNRWLWITVKFCTFINSLDYSL